MTRARRPVQRRGWTNHGVVEGPINVSGNRIPVRIERPRLDITREAGTRLRLREEGGGTSRLIVEAERRRPRPRPAPERPFFDFNEMQRILEERVLGKLQGSRLEFREIGDAKYKSRWFGKGGIWANLEHPARGILKNEWFGIHPLKLAGAATTTKGGRGVTGYLRERRFLRRTEADRKARKFRRGPEADSEALNAEQKYAQALEHYRHNAQHALADLQAAVAAGRVNWGNRNTFFQGYQKILDGIDSKFEKELYDIVNSFTRLGRKK